MGLLDKFRKKPSPENLRAERKLREDKRELERAEARRKEVMSRLVLLGYEADNLARRPKRVGDS